MNRYFLGIDAGTSALKALLIDERGLVAGQGSAGYALQTPQPGWVEADPEQWWQALCAATTAALQSAGIDGDAVAAISFSGQMHTLVLLDAAGAPVRPAISWADARGTAELLEIEQRVGRERLIATTGSPAVSAFSATKLLWVRRHEPDIWARARWALLAKDYLRLRLSGIVASDPTDAGATGLLDLRARDWSDAVLEALALPRELLPPIHPSAALVGRVTAEAASATGLCAGTPVGCGAGDQECAALGCGVSAPGTLLITAGTGGQVFAATEQPIVDPHGRLHSLPHAVPGRWHVMAAIPAAGLALSWLRGLLPGDTPAQSQPSAQPPIFVPALAGERTPWMDEAASAAFFGLNLSHTAADLSAAAYEGVAFALRACVEVLSELGLPMETLAVTGGLSNSPSFMSLLADVLGRTLVPSAQREGSAYGAARLAALAIDALPCPASPLLSSPPVQPDPARAAWHARRYEVYRQLYTALRAARE